MKIAVTCLQLIRDLDQHRARLEDAGLSVSVPVIVGQRLVGDDLAAAIDGCVGVIAGDDRFTADVLDRCPALRVISKWGIGIDGIDLAVAAARGITVTNTPGVFDDEVADVAVGYIVMLARHLHLIDRGVHGGSWPKLPGTSLRGATLGIVGLGGIGRAVAVRAAAAGMIVCGSDPSPESAVAAATIGVSIVPFDDLLAASDFVSVNCPLTSETFHLFDAGAFARMKPGAYVVNTGRGAVVATDDLVAALDTGRLAGAALDVIEEEPPSTGSVLLGRPDVILGSHNASNTLQASARVHVLAIDNLIRGLGVTVSS
jgi:phosphoglycerate dehydrogenase-like enzyme